MNVIFIAPPAAGKGTYSSLLVDNYDYVKISTGDLLRAEIRSNSELGKEIAMKTDRGEFVSDKLITGILKKEIEKNIDKKFVLDGYPRNIQQANLLSELFKELAIDNYLVIYLDVNKDVASKRALGRLICENCEAVYNIYDVNHKPEIEGICDVCQHELVNRTDDTLETFNVRYDTFVDNTKPMIEFYEKQNKLYIVNANNSSLEAFKEVEKVMGLDR